MTNPKPQPGRPSQIGPMVGYGDATYGDAFADVYDDWYATISDIDATVADLLDLVTDGPILELGVGTGRLAIPLAQAAAAHSIRVAGVDSSTAMLDKLAAGDADALVEVHHGHMVIDMPVGPFELIFIAYNTLFNLTDVGAQAECFAAAAQHLSPGGRFVVEAFVPGQPFRDGDDVSVRTLATDQVVLSISRYQSSEQRAEGQFIEFTETAGVRLRPWSIRYSTPEQLDDLAATSGFALEHRWAGFGRQPFDDGSARHVSVYRLPN